MQKLLFSTRQSRTVRMINLTLPPFISSLTLFFREFITWECEACSCYWQTSAKKFIKKCCSWLFLIHRKSFKLFCYITMVQLLTSSVGRSTCVTSKRTRRREKKSFIFSSILWMLFATHEKYFLLTFFSVLNWNRRECFIAHQTVFFLAFIKE